MKAAHALILGGGVIGRTGKLRWRLNRLRCMTPSEVAHRVVRAVSAGAERSGMVVLRPVPPPDFRARPRPWVHADGVLVDPLPYLNAADRIAAGRLDVFALHDIDIGTPPRWNHDPKTGVQAPRRYGRTLDYRDPGLVGDIKYLWEINRHLHLVTLAQAYSLSGDTRYFEVLRTHLESWFEACPYPVGPNWSSALESALRLINWSAAWQLLGGHASAVFATPQGAGLRQRWLESIYRHAQFICGNFSLYSSANNHLLGEATGLFIASNTWPCWPRARAWRKASRAMLEREVPLQTAADGVNLEQAVSYQQFVLDLLLLALLAGKANRQWFSVTYESRVEAMLEYLASIMDAGGNVPMIGDADDARVVGLGHAGDSSYRSLLATGAVLFGRGDFKLKAGSVDDKTRWLLGRRADEAFETQKTTGARLPIRRAFKHGGYYILGCDFESSSEIRMVVDAGPLGYQAIAAHGHADALACTLSVGGLEFLVDTGTFAYHTQGDWRSYFRGTAAHNTIRIDATDQSQPGGNFIWLRKARAGCTAWSSTSGKDVFEGWQDGYMSLPDPVMHTRRITLNKRNRTLLIEDSLDMIGEHDVELFFHCSEHCEVEPGKDGYRLRREGGAISLDLPREPGGSSNVLCGSIAPMGGWVSRRFDHKSPAPTIVWRARLAGPTVLRTKIAC